MLSVLHVGTSLGFRGGEQQMLFLISGLRERGVRVFALVPERGALAERLRAERIDVFPLTARGDLDLTGVFGLRRALGQSRPDMMHLHTARAHAIGRLALAGHAHRPGIIVSRQVAFPAKGGPFRRLKYAHGVDRYIAVSQAAATSVRDAGVDPERITVVPCGIDPRVFAVPRDRDGLRRELAIPPGSKLVGFAGALEEGKGPSDLLEAVAGLPRNVHVLMTGEGPLRVRLEHRSLEADLAGRVHLLGWRQDFPRILRSLDAFCLPSRQEGFPNAILDALAAEVPVIATQVGGIPEIVVSGRNGLLLEARDPEALRAALLRVLDDPELAALLAGEGRRTVNEFTVDRMVERTLAVYHDVLAGRSGSEVSGGKGATSC
ncbi:MAG TPA: glycosyltransferase [Dongiaceae bacterium]|jgi:glycosyltransferase involved in cell wall biosynthesis|nr:glycosyltransferase [Dongiaceae bacterium]